MNVTRAFADAIADVVGYGAIVVGIMAAGVVVIGIAMWAAEMLGIYSPDVDKRKK